MNRACNELSGIVTVNASAQKINRSQIHKDLAREEIIINGQSYESPDDLIHMKRDLLSNVLSLDDSSPDRPLQSRSLGVSSHPSSSPHSLLSHRGWSLFPMSTLI